MYLYIVFFCLVNRRDAATLLPITQNVIRPDSIIHSDQWRAYHGIQQQIGLQHRTVNHSLNFVDPDTGVRTQHIKWYWSKCKGRFKAMHGTTIGKLPSYLDKFMCRDRCGRTQQDCFDNIQRHITELYPV
jgi:transposase-like protein